jgi:hypothetical protein
MTSYLPVTIKKRIKLTATPIKRVESSIFERTGYSSPDSSLIGIIRYRYRLIVNSLKSESFIDLKGLEVTRRH